MSAEEILAKARRDFRDQLLDERAGGGILAALIKGIAGKLPATLPELVCEPWVSLSDAGERGLGFRLAAADESASPSLYVRLLVAVTEPNDQTTLLYREGDHAFLNGSKELLGAPGTSISKKNAALLLVRAFGEFFNAVTNVPGLVVDSLTNTYTTEDRAFQA
jgi:hypothetical protein